MTYYRVNTISKHYQYEMLENAEQMFDLLIADGNTYVELAKVDEDATAYMSHSLRIYHK